MYRDMFIAAAFLCVGLIVFGHFEAGTPRWRRLLKAAFFIGLTGFLSVRFGSGAALGWVAFAGALGLSVHTWWTRRHGIGWLSAEPYDRYRALRGWTRRAGGS